MEIEGKQLFDASVVELIKRRKSIRTYAKTPVAGEVKTKLQQLFQATEGPFPAQIRLEWLEKTAVAAARQKLGTYGVIQGASSFIGVAVEPKEYALEQLGYVVERLILYLTSLGLGTCWLSGTFNKDDFSQAMQVGPGEIFPVITPVGRASGLRSPIDLLMKPLPNQKTRKDWELLFFKNDFHTVLREPETGDYAIPLEMVRLAPSAANRQPWRIVKQGRDFHFYLAYDASFSKKRSYNIQEIDLGIAMFHFEATAREMGLKGGWELRTPELERGSDDFKYRVTWVSQ